MLSRVYFSIFIFISSLFFGLLYSEWTETVQAVGISVSSQSSTTLKAVVKKRIKKRVKPPAQKVKGLYLTAYSAGNATKIDEIIDLIDRTELNAVVIDIKDYSGKVLYDSGVELVDELELEDDRIGDARALIKKLHSRDIYVIARQTVFQDPILAERKSEWAIKSKTGGLWRDNLKLAWIDPTQIEVWDYNVAIAKEAIGLGFDEINFDYVRFPSDGDLSQVVYTNGAKKKYEVMRDFYHYLNTKLAKKPAYISLDFFGFVMERHDGMSIGQRLVDAVEEVDYISPMMYPSHYPSGYLGLKNPAANPGVVIENGMKAGTPFFVDKRAQIRPWLQAFNLGAIYDATKIRAQIDQVEKYTKAGWLLWNAANKYTTAGLKLE